MDVLQYKHTKLKAGKEHSSGRKTTKIDMLKDLVNVSIKKKQTNNKVLIF